MRRAQAASVLLLAWACGPAEPEVGTTALALVPAGSNAAFLGHTIPDQMSPGERLDVRVTVRNTGTSTLGSIVDWNTSSYVLYRISTAWAWTSDPVIPTIPACGGGPCTAANDSSFDFVITAPAPNPSATFSAQMRLHGESNFGPTLAVSGINVSSANPRRWSCALVSSDIPPLVGPGEARIANVVVTNNGTGTWSPGQRCFYSRDAVLGLPPANIHKWGAGATCVALTSPVLPGAQHTFTFPIVAPTTLGQHTIVRQMFDSGPTGVGFFDLGQGCLQQTITVSDAAPRPPGKDALFVSHNLPTEMSPGERLDVRITVRNHGISAEGLNADWNTAQHVLYRSSAIWGWTSDAVVPTIPACGNGPCGPQNETNFDFVIVAPPETPNATFSARMRVGATPFGPTFTAPPIRVSVQNPRRWSCGLVSSNIPPVMGPGEVRTANIVVTNNGTGTWSPGQRCFYSRDGVLGLPPANIHKWGSGGTCVVLTTSVEPGASHTFTFPITAPTTLGQHTIIRQMFDSGPTGVGFFDQSQGCLQQTVTISNNAPRPPGKDALFITHNFPTEMSPGERLDVRVTVQNNGITDATVNADWNTTQHVLYRANPIWGWTSDAVTPTIPACGDGPCGPQNETNFDFVIVAPPETPSATFSARMRAGATGFGPTFTAPLIRVSAQNPRRWSCGLVSSDIPAFMAPGEARTANVVVTNDGTGTWSPGQRCFYSRDGVLGLPPANIHKWGGGATCVALSSVVPPGGEHTFTFPIVAPTTPGQHTIVRQMFDYGPTGVGFFDLGQGCLDQSVTVAPALAAEIVAQSIPPQLIVTDLVPFSVTMRNTGSAPWTGPNFGLTSANTPVNLWNHTLTSLEVGETVAPGATREFRFYVTVPATFGLYQSRWQMSRVDVGVFGPVAIADIAASSVSFGINGFVLGGLPGFAGGVGDRFLSVAADDQEAALCAGYAVTTTGTKVALLTRYLRTGSLDPFFGASGVVTLDFGIPAASHQFDVVKIDALGRLLAAGRTGDGTGRYRTVIARFLPNGALDTSFGQVSGAGRLGYVIGPGAPFTQPSFRAALGFSSQPANLREGWTTLHLDTQGRLLVGGAMWAFAMPPPGGPPLESGLLLVARYAEDGALDPTYGAGGFNAGYPDPFGGPIFNFSGGSVDFLADTAIEGDSLTVLGWGYSGRAYNGGTPVGFLIHYDENGARDLSFGGPGAIDGVFKRTGERFDRLLKPSSGGILVLGWWAETLPGPLDGAIGRLFTPQGAPDTSLGPNGLEFMSWIPPGVTRFTTFFEATEMVILANTDASLVGGDDVGEAIAFGLDLTGFSPIPGFNVTGDPETWWTSTVTNGVSEWSTGYDDGYFGGVLVDDSLETSFDTYRVGTSGGRTFVARFQENHVLDGIFDPPN